MRTIHSGDESAEELYEYADGELVAIKQPGHVIAPDLTGALTDIFGGWLTVERDAHGPLALVAERGWGVVWSRCEEPWSELLARGADTIAEQAVAAVMSARLPKSARAFGLALRYIGQHSLWPEVCVLIDGAQRSALWGPYGDDGPVIELDGWDFELDQLLLQEAGLNQAGDPFRAVLDAVAFRLARHDWGGVLELAEDFVVISSEHDELTWPKYQSLLACNPPERIAAWRAAWPQGARLAQEDLRYP